jgi:hypothetical protein
VTEEPYDVDTDMGDDPEESEAAELERRIEPDYDIQEYDFEDDDSRGERGISEAVRDERNDVYPRQSWGGETRSAEEEAVNEIDDGYSPDVGEGAAVRSPHPGEADAHRADAHGADERDRTADPAGYVPDAEDPKDTGAPDA